jgi:periplasmic protein TonB
MESNCYRVSIKITTMDPKKMLQASFLDILFEGRNKEYGAYQLRKNYPKRLLSAVTVAGSLAALLILLSFTLPRTKSDTAGVVATDVDIAQAKRDNIPPPPVIQPPPPQVKQPRVQTTQFTPPVFLPPKLVLQSDMVTDPEDILNVSDRDIDGERIPLATSPKIPGDDPGGVVEQPQQPEKPKEDEIFTSVEIEASFKGKFVDFLQKHLRYPPEAANRNESGLVIIEFVVDREGRVSGARVADNSPAKYPSLEQEAIRIINKSSGLWNPGKQNDVAVRSYHVQGIKFELTEEE